MQLPSCVRELVPGVTVIVPHGGAERLHLLHASLPRLRDARGVARIVLVELDEVPRAVELGRRFADFHVFAPGAPPFHKTRAMNIGLAFVRTTHFLWLDSDMLLPEEFVADAWRECAARALDCLLPWSEVHYLSEADSREVATDHRAPDACVPVSRFASNVMVPGSAVVARTEFALRHGGMSEQFRGWGCEDTAWFIKVRTLGSVGVTGQASRILHHLYHPTSGGYSAGADVFARPEYRRNFAILTLMKSYQTPETFSRRFPAPAHFTAPWPGTRRFVCARGAEAIAAVLQQLYGEAVMLCDAGAQADATLLPSSADDAWDAALAAVCRASMDLAA
ncbi:MAG: hypothetical protein ABSC95_19540 [Acetobacteraceae bacterium]